MKILFNALSINLWRGWAALLALALSSNFVTPAWATLNFNSSNNTVTDSTTSLVWDRCAYGLSSSTCTTGVVFYDTWVNALAAATSANNSNYRGFSDWRVPNKNELESIAKIDTYTAGVPAIDTTAFPATPVDWFWTSTSFVPDPTGVWVVAFVHGNTYAGGKAYPNYLRLVRGGQTYSTADALNATASGLPASIEFGSQTIGSTSSAQSFSLSNSSTAALVVSSITASVEFKVTHNCTTVGVGQSCPVYVTFSPSSVGARTGTLTIASNSVSSPNLVSLNGSGSTAALSFSSVDRSSISFASQVVSTTSAAEIVTVSNTGGLTFSISDITVSGNFARSGGSCTTTSTLAPAASCTIGITFTPAIPGTNPTGTLTIASNASNSPSSVILSGSGTTFPQVSLNQTSLAFGGHSINPVTTTNRTVTLTNSGNAILALTNIGASNSDFTVAHDCGTNLAVGSLCSLTIGFRPTTAGSKTGTISIASNASSSPNSISLTGTGTTAQISFGVIDSVVFANQRMTTTSATQAVTLQNSGNAEMILTSITASKNFSVTHNCGSNVSAGGSCSLSIAFQPTQLGTLFGTIGVTSNAQNSPFSLNLIGTGLTNNLPPACTLAASSPSVRKGGVATLTVTCDPAAGTYIWTGGTCVGVTASTCTVSPTEATLYSVTGTNSYGFSTATKTVTLRSVDLGPILMLLLDD